MRDLIQRVRNWLIKRLGGYTATEYWKALHPPLHDQAVLIERKNIVRVTATLKIPQSEIMAHGFPSSAGGTPFELG